MDSNIAQAFALGRDTAEWISQHRHRFALRDGDEIPAFDRDALASRCGEFTPAMDAAYRAGFREGMDKAQGTRAALALLHGRMN